MGLPSYWKIGSNSARKHLVMLREAAAMTEMAENEILREDTVR